jgi:ketopantoate reductase
MRRGGTGWRPLLRKSAKWPLPTAVVFIRMEILSILGALPPAMRSSMQKDLSAGLEPEVDAIGGAIIRAGKRYEIGVPVIEVLVRGIAGRSKGLV